MGEFWVWYDQEHTVLRRYRIKVNAPTEAAATVKVYAHYVHGDVLNRDELASCVYERDIETEENHFIDVKGGTDPWLG